MKFAIITFIIISLFSTVFSMKEFVRGNMQLFTLYAPYRMPEKKMEEFIVSLPSSRNGVVLENDEDDSRVSCVTVGIREDLDFFSNLVYLSLHNVELKNFTGIKPLKSLISLTCNELRNLISLKGLKNLQQLKQLTLSLYGNNLQDFKEDAIPQSVEYLSISHGGLTSLKGLRNLNQLQTLIVKSNELRSIERDYIPKSVTKLDISFNKLDDIFALRFCPHLSIVKCNNNRIKNIESVYFLIAEGNLKKLDIAKNNFSIKTVKNLLESLVFCLTKDTASLRQKNVALSLQKLVFGMIEEKNQKLVKKQEVIHKKLLKLEKSKKEAKDILSFMVLHLDDEKN